MSRNRARSSAFSLPEIFRSVISYFSLPDISEFSVPGVFTVTLFLSAAMPETCSSSVTASSMYPNFLFTVIVDMF